MPTTPQPPAPCPAWCTRPAGHGLHAGGEWTRVHLGAPFDTPLGEGCWLQTDRVTATAVTAGPLQLATATADVPVAAPRPALAVAA